VSGFGVQGEGSAGPSCDRQPLGELTILRQLLTSSPDIVFVKDSHGHYLASNPAHDELVGHPHAEIIGKHDLQLHADSEAVRYNLATDKQVIASGEIFQATGQPIPFRGETRYFDIVKSPLYSESGEVIGIIGVARDITRLHLIEDKLRNKGTYLSAFNQAVLDLTHHSSTPNRYRGMLEAAVTMLNIDYSAIYLATDTQQTLELESRSGQVSDELEHASRKIARIAWRTRSNASERLLSEDHVSGQDMSLQALLLLSGTDAAGVVVFASHKEAENDEAHADMLLVRDHLSMALGQQKLLIEVEHRAYHDAVTGLANRYSFEQSIDRYLTEALQYQTVFSLAFMDLDGFKEVNDTLGHDAGDQLLERIGERLTRYVHESDTLARIGGDEFALLISSKEDRASVEAIAQEIELLFSEPFVIDGGQPVSVGVSIGLSTYPQDGTTSSELIVGADRAMYKAKEGKGRRIRLAA